MGLVLFSRDGDEILNRRVHEEQMYGARLVMIVIFVGLSLTMTQAFNMGLLTIEDVQLYFLALLFASDQSTRLFLFRETVCRFPERSLPKLAGSIAIKLENTEFHQFSSGRKRAL